MLPSQYWNHHITQQSHPPPPPRCIRASPATTFHWHLQEGNGDKTGDKTLRLSQMCVCERFFCLLVLDCEPQSETNKDFTWWLSCGDSVTTLPHPTLQTKSSFFVVDVQKVENNIIELTLYTCTPYMLNTVNVSPLYADFLLLCMARECTPFLFFSFKTQKCERTKRAPCHRGRNNPVRLLY